MLITIDLNSETPIYIQLRNRIVEGITTGTLKAGDTLPSVRQMAGDLGINLHTVNKVYRLLKTEGFLTIHRQKGVIVNTALYYAADDSYRNKLKETLKPILIESYCRGVTVNEVEKFIQEVYKNISKKNPSGK